MSVPLRHYPGFNRFTLDWLDGNPSATRFLPRPPLPNGDGLKLMAGQQLGFAGGPLYTLAKVATLIKMKRQLAAQGKKATAYFWLATEDHDWDEVATLCLPVSTISPAKELNRQRDLHCMRAIRQADARAAVGSLPVPEPLIRELLALYDIAPRPQWLREGITLRESFAGLLQEVFGDEIVLIDALDPDLRRAGAPLFEQIHKHHDDIQHALKARAKELEAAGYAQQVIPPDGEHYTLLFHLDDQGVRQPSTINHQPERTSTSALTRPLLQDYVIRPDVFIGGPSEVAYYAQIAPLHEMLGITLPRVGLRGHTLVAPQRVLRAIDRYELDPAHLFAGADELLVEKEPEKVARIRDVADAARADLMKHVEAIRELALPADHSLAGSIQRSIGHLDYHVNKLAERAIKGMLRKERERFAAVTEVVRTLYPDRNVQDRIAGWFGWWCQYGPHLTERIIEEIEPDSDSFRIVSL